MFKLYEMIRLKQLVRLMQMVISIEYYAQYNFGRLKCSQDTIYFIFTNESFCWMKMNLYMESKNNRIN